MITIRATSNRLGELSGALRGLAEEALDHGVTTLIEVADPRTPVDTGALKANKVIEKGSGSRTITWVQEYAAYQEFGTSRGVPARAFARTGAEAGLEAIESHLRTFGR